MATWGVIAVVEMFCILTVSFRVCKMTMKGNWVKGVRVSALSLTAACGFTVQFSCSVVSDCSPVDCSTPGLPVNFIFLPTMYIIF